MKNISYLEAKVLNEVAKHNIYYSRVSLLNQVCFDILFKAYNSNYDLTLQQEACLVNLLNKLKCNHRIPLRPHINKRISVFTEGFWNMNGLWYNDDIWKNERV